MRIEVGSTHVWGIFTWNEGSDWNSQLNSRGRDLGVFSTVQCGHVNGRLHCMFQYHFLNQVEWNTCSHSFVIWISESGVKLSRQTTQEFCENFVLNLWCFPCFILLKVAQINSIFEICSGVANEYGSGSFHL